MKRLVLATSIALLAGGGGVARPHPGHMTPTVTIAELKFAPDTVQAIAGDTVVWFWNGPDTNHSVTSDAGSAQEFDSDKGTAAGAVNHPVNDAYAVTFAAPGTYAYHCKVHSFMQGTVQVAKAPPTSPARPKLTRVSASPTRVRSATTVRFTVSEKADVQIVVKRRRGSRAVGGTLREQDITARKGANRRRVTFGRLEPGDYAIRVVAVSPSTGLSSKTATLKVTLLP